MVTFTAARQTDWVRAQYASPFRVATFPAPWSTADLSHFADKVLREETGRGLYQHGHNDSYHDGHRRIHAAGFRFQA